MSRTLFRYSRCGLKVWNANLKSILHNFNLAKQTDRLNLEGDREKLEIPTTLTILFYLTIQLY